VTLNVAPVHGAETKTQVDTPNLELLAKGRHVRPRFRKRKAPVAAAVPAEARGAEMPMSTDELTAPEGAVGDSMTVAVWTMLSRITGFVRVATVAAVLGPTFFGNSYQFTNSLPNLVYYGFLAGSLFSSLLVPALVRHIDRGDRASAERVASGLFGVVGAGMLLVLPLAVLVAPELLRLASVGTTPGSHAGELGVGRLLVAMLMPQILFYGVIGTSTAVQNAYRKFALPAAAPLIENVGTIAVLLLVWFLFPPIRGFNNVPLAELLLLGLGSTAAVGLHAAVQWWGARRVGVSLRPRAGWRNSEVQVVMRRAVPSLVQAGAAACELIILLVLADRVAGGVVAFQISLNFYFLPVAIAATPVALSLIPRLARIEGHSADFHDTLLRGLAFSAFLTVPAATGYVVLAGPLGRAVALGRMNSPEGIALVTSSIRTLGPGLIGEAAFLIITYAAYSRNDTRTPLRAMGVQVAVCLPIAAASLFFHGSMSLSMLGAALSVGTLVSAGYLYVTVARSDPGEERLGWTMARFGVGAAAMAGPAWLVARYLGDSLTGRAGTEISVLVAVMVGGAVFVAVQLLMRSRELGWVAASFGLRGSLAGEAL
jgi:murein biosynthesis integral membrane protein MurJ